MKYSASEVDNEAFFKERCKRPTHEWRVLITESVLQLASAFSSVRSLRVVSALSLISDKERVVVTRH